ncbi:MAG: molybdenum cofactor guanylyltransferase MobA [Alcanivoracaceae bacterium]
MTAQDWQLLILAGGRGRRLGGIDKGLMEGNGQPVVRMLHQRFQPPHCLVSANRHAERYCALGFTTVADRRPDFAGPLAGLEALMVAAPDLPAILVPCDMPNLPDDLPAQLLSRLQRRDAIVVAHDGERLQPLCMALWPTYWRDNLAVYLDQGGRSVQGWLDSKQVEVCQFDDGRCFHNINTPADLTNPALWERQSGRSHND